MLFRIYSMHGIVRVCILLGYAGLSSRQLQPYDIVFERITSLGAAYMCTYRSSSRQMEIDICVQLLYKKHGWSI